MGDRVVLLQRIEPGGLIPEKRLTHRQRVLRQQQRVAVRRRSRDMVPAEVAVGARTVLDDDRLSNRLR